MIKNRIISTAGTLPKKVLTNFDLESTVDTSNDWIIERTGIHKRHMVESETTSDLAYQASLSAIEQAGIEPNNIDVLMLCTTTPDHTFPATSVKIQSMLGIKNCFALDIQAVCSGFVYGLHMIDSILKNNDKAKYALLIGADTLSRIIDWTDRTTCILFGDGAGASVIQSIECESNDKDSLGIIDSVLYSDGDTYDLLRVNGGISQEQNGHITMEGREVFKHAVRNMSQVCNELLERNNITFDDIDYFVPHQANMRIITALAEKLNLSRKKVIITVDQHANTSAASIPLALDHALKNNIIKKGHLIMTVSLGGGLTWGANLIRYG